jgi:hypothetical protein
MVMAQSLADPGRAPAAALRRRRSLHQSHARVQTLPQDVGATQRVLREYIESMRLLFTGEKVPITASS